MSELKPCPFCGTSVVGIEHDGLYRWVECGNMDCNAAGKVFAFLTDVGNADHIVANNWNTRPIEDALNARIAELELRLDVYNGNMYDVVVDENAKANKRIAELEAERRWIPVSERLPEEKQSVLALDRTGTAYHWEYSKCLSNIFVGYYTHWMPLPEPPEVKE